MPPGAPALQTPGSASLGTREKCKFSESRSHPRPTELGTPGVGPAICINKLSKVLNYWFGATRKAECCSESDMTLESDKSGLSPSSAAS